VGTFRPLSVNDLALRANLNKGQASRAAQTLVDQGLVLKAPSTTDGRGVILTLTAKGQKIWNRLMAVVEQRNAEIVSCLTPQEVQQFSKLLDRLLEQARLHHQTE
jgi:DNA-binding MarR family transcriptional regulator